MGLGRNKIVITSKLESRPLSIRKRIVFRLITLLPLLTIVTVVLWLFFFTNLPQLLYSQSIRNINFDCQESSTGYYVYKMKPGKCRAKNLEYDITMSFDSNGFRNGIRSTDHYDVAVIGDSHAQGAGVADDKSFSYLLESTYHYQTMNLGIGSYATMRELEALATYGSHAKYVVVQYCDNDFAENEESIRLSKEDFRAQAEKQWNEIRHSYKAGKSRGYMAPLHNLAVLLWNGSYSSKSTWRRTLIDKRPIELEASTFGQIIERYRRLLEGKRLIVIEIASYGANSPRFEDSFGAELNKISGLQYRIINSARILNYDDYFFFDGHINSRGHRKLAAVLSQEITAWESKSPLINQP